MVENTDIVGNTDIADAGNGHDDCQADEKEDSPDSPADDKGNATIGNDIMEESKSLQLFQKVSDIMAGEQVFDPEFQLSRLCELAGSNARYVSFVIGKFHGKTFKALLSEIRIKKACMILSDPNCNAKLDAICCDVGFKSRTAFSIAFKNSTGLSPTEFRNASKRYSQNQ